MAGSAGDEGEQPLVSSPPASPVDSSAAAMRERPRPSTLQLRRGSSEVGTSGGIVPLHLPPPAEAAAPAMRPGLGRAASMAVPRSSIVGASSAAAAVSHPQPLRSAGSSTSVPHPSALFDAAAASTSPPLLAHSPSAARSTPAHSPRLASSSPPSSAALPSPRLSAAAAPATPATPAANAGAPVPAPPRSARGSIFTPGSASSTTSTSATSRRSRAAAQREQMMRREDEAAARMAALREESGESGGGGGGEAGVGGPSNSRHYDFRQLLLQPPSARSDDEVLFLCRWLRDLAQGLRVSFLSSLPVELLAVLCRHLSLQRLEADQTVFEQGDEAQHFYVLLSGSVGVHVRKEGERATGRKRARQKIGGPRAGFLEVLVLRSGEAFGEVALLRPDEKRSASVRCKEPCELLVLDRATYELALRDQASLERTRRELFVREHPILRRLSSDKQAALVSSLRERVVVRHALIVREGEPLAPPTGEGEACMYFVAAGSVVLRQSLPISRAATGAQTLHHSSSAASSAPMVDLCRLSAGSFFCDEGVLLDLSSSQSPSSRSSSSSVRREYTAQADSAEMRLYVLDRSALLRCVRGQVLASLQEMATAKRALRMKRMRHIVEALGAQQSSAHQSSGSEASRSRLSYRAPPPAAPPIEPTFEANQALRLLRPLSLRATRRSPSQRHLLGVTRVGGRLPLVVRGDGGDDKPPQLEPLFDEQQFSVFEDDGDDEDEERFTWRSGSRSPARSRRASLSHASWEEELDLELASSSSRPVSRGHARARSMTASRATSRAQTPTHSRPHSRAASRSLARTHSPLSFSPPLPATAASSPPAPSPPPPMLPVHTMAALLGRRHQAAPLALLTDPHIPLSALSALSPQPLPHATLQSAPDRKDPPYADKQQPRKAAHAPEESKEADPAECPITARDFLRLSSLRSQASSHASTASLHSSTAAASSEDDDAAGSQREEGESSAQAPNRASCMLEEEKQNELLSSRDSSPSHVFLSRVPSHLRAPRLSATLAPVDCDPLLTSSGSFTTRSSGPILFGSSGSVAASATSLAPVERELSSNNSGEQAPSQDAQSLESNDDEKSAEVTSASPSPSRMARLTQRRRFTPLESATLAMQLTSATPDPSLALSSLTPGVGTARSAANPAHIVRLAGSQTERGSRSTLASAGAATSRVGSHSRPLPTRRGCSPLHPFALLSRAGSVRMVQARVDLNEARQQLARSVGGSGALADAQCFVYRQSGIGSAPAVGNSSVASPAQHPSSLLPSSSVSAIERYLHTQLAELDASAGALALPAFEPLEAAQPTAPQFSSTHRVGSAGCGSALPMLDIRALEQLATRAHGQRHALDKQRIAQSQAQPHPPATSSSHSARPHSKQRQTTPFSLAALLALDEDHSVTGSGPSAAKLKIASSRVASARLIQQLRRQVEQPF